MTSTKKEKTFEESFVRLEQILEKMSDEKASLDQSLALYEEADGLITYCGKRLLEAERKVETLIKKRDGTLKLSSNNTPETEEFSL